MPHKPVLLQEVLRCLNLRPGMVVVDGTVGNGGHALEMVKGIGPEGKLIALDQDPAAIQRSQMVLKDFPQAFFYPENFKNLENVLETLNIPAVDAVILDVGFSSDQLETAERGFSFEREGPLDMRMNPAMPRSARDFVNDLSQEELEELFRQFGEERWARRFASAICKERAVKSIETTTDLARIIENALPKHLQFRKGNRPSWARYHPATRIFQALRIAVNDELGSLTEGLPRIWNRIKEGGRFAVISFHSLEDRIVKNQFRQWKQNKEAMLLTKKPIRASLEEVKDNPRARSAKLRAVEKRHEGTR